MIFSNDWLKTKGISNLFYGSAFLSWTGKHGGWQWFPGTVSGRACRRWRSLDTPLQRRHGDNRAHCSRLPHYGFPTLTYSQSIPHQCLFLKAEKQTNKSWALFCWVWAYSQATFCELYDFPLLCSSITYCKDMILNLGVHLDKLRPKNSPSYVCILTFSLR